MILILNNFSKNIKLRVRFFLLDVPQHITWRKTRNSEGHGEIDLGWNLSKNVDRIIQFS